MVHNIFSYRRPSPVKQLYSSNASQRESEHTLHRLQSSNGSSRNIAGIPDELSFDRIIEGATCPVLPHFHSRITFVLPGSSRN
jgi:hypothetical protein